MADASPKVIKCPSNELHNSLPKNNWLKKVILENGGSLKSNETKSTLFKKLSDLNITILYPSFQPERTERKKVEVKKKAVKKKKTDMLKRYIGCCYCDEHILLEENKDDIDLLTTHIKELHLDRKEEFETMIYDEPCVICIESIESTQDDYTCSVCQTKFHLKCIDTWKSTSVTSIAFYRTPSCPICRNKLD